MPFFFHRLLETQKAHTPNIMRRTQQIIDCISNQQIFDKGGVHRCLKPHVEQQEMEIRSLRTKLSDAGKVIERLRSKSSRNTKPKTPCLIQNYVPKGTGGEPIQGELRGKDCTYSHYTIYPSGQTICVFPNGEKNKREGVCLENTFTKQELSKGKFQRNLVEVCDATCELKLTSV